MIIENQYFDEIEKLWKDNNNGYIPYESNKTALKDDEMLKLVYEENGTIMGYCIVYLKKDFCEVEGYPNKIENMPNKVGYIWEIVSDKNHSGKGVATKMLEYVKEKFKGYTFYSCVDLRNTPSLNLNMKNGFEIIYEFEKKDNTKHAILKIDL